MLGHEPFFLDDERTVIQGSQSKKPGCQPENSGDGNRTYLQIDTDCKRRIQGVLRRPEDPVLQVVD